MRLCIVAALVRLGRRASSPLSAEVRRAVPPVPRHSRHVTLSLDKRHMDSPYQSQGRTLSRSHVLTLTHTQPLTLSHAVHGGLSSGVHLMHAHDMRTHAVVITVEMSLRFCI